MAVRPIDANELLGIERLLDTDVVRQSKTASWLLNQVLHDIQAMPTLTPPNEWISVVERLPDKPRHYLVCTSVNYWHGGCMDKNGVSSNKGTTDGYVGTTLSVLDCFYDTTGDWNRVCNKHVTHWMNIPAPPDRRPPERQEDT